MRQNQRGRVPLVQTITKVTKQLLDMTPRDEVSGDELAVARALLVNAKKLALIE